MKYITFLIYNSTIINKCLKDVVYGHLVIRTKIH